MDNMSPLDVTVELLQRQSSTIAMVVVAIALVGYILVMNDGLTSQPCTDGGCTEQGVSL